MIKRVLTAVVLSGSIMMTTLALPASATSNSSRLANCERTAAERYARNAQAGNSNARQQFNRDIARCKRRFG